MLHCSDVQKNLTFYLEGEIEGSAANEIQAHLSACTNCSEMLEKEQVFLSLLKGNLSAPAAPALLRSQVKSKLRSNRKARVFWRWQFAPALVGVALVVFFMSYDPATQLGWAVNAHTTAKNNIETLDIKTQQPLVLKEWIARQVSLPFPVMTEFPAGIHLQGGKIITEKNEHIVQVLFSSDQGVSSLYIMPKGFTRLRGHSVALKKLNFFPQKKKGHFMTAWIGADAAYVLVSETKDGINQGCFLCHTNGSEGLPPTTF